MAEMKLVTQRQFDAALVAVLSENVTRNVPNRIDRLRMAIHTIFLDELEKGPLNAEVEVIRAGARTLQEYGQFKWAKQPVLAEEASDA